MSQRHPGSRRTPHQKEHEDDVFIARVLEVSSWGARHRQALIGIGIVVAVLVAGGLYWQNYQASLREQATQELVAIQQTRAFGDPAQARADLQVYLQRFGGTPQADEARLLLGQVELETGNPQGAVEALEPLAGSRSPMGGQATYLLASAHEELGQVDQAERMYLSAANSAEISFFARDALAQAARIRMDRSDYTGAVQLYEEVLSYFEEGDPERQLYEMRLAEARAAREG